MPDINDHHSVRLLCHRISVSVSISVFSIASGLLWLSRILSRLLRLNISLLWSVTLLRL